VRTFHVLEFIRSSDGVWSFPGEHVDRLRAEFPSLEFSSPRDAGEADRLLPGAEVVFGWAVKAENFPSARRLRWVHVSAAGVTPLLFPAMVESDVTLTNGRGLHSVAMAEHTLGVMLSFTRKLHLARDAQRDRRWTQDALWQARPEFGQLGGATLGVVGLGSVGSAIAERARALGMRVVAVRRHPAADPAPADAQWGIEALPRLLEASDWVVLAAPLTGVTRGIVGAREIAMMKPGAVLINLGRGALVDESALAAALAAGRIAGAALDVFEREPLPPESPLWSMPQVIVSPHVSGFGPRYGERASDLFGRNLRRYLAGEPLLNVVDKRAGY
jgi:phosphoglycerate dehydrogenase-like enzyme